MPAKIDRDNVIGYDPRFEIDRLLAHELHQLGPIDAMTRLRQALLHPVRLAIRGQRLP